MDFEVCDVIDATYNPKRLDTLRGRAKRHIGERLRWQCIGTADEGTYAGQLMWEQYPPTEHVDDWMGWAPHEDLDDIASVPFADRLSGRA